MLRLGQVRVPKCRGGARRNASLRHPDWVDVITTFNRAYKEQHASDGTTREISKVWALKQHSKVAKLLPSVKFWLLQRERENLMILQWLVLNKAFPEEPSCTGLRSAHRRRNHRRNHTLRPVVSSDAALCSSTDGRWNCQACLVLLAACYRFESTSMAEKSPDSRHIFAFSCGR